MRIGVPRELEPGERRVALVPDAVTRLAPGGFEVVVEPGAGAAASFPDDAYAAAGASVSDSVWDADAVAKVRKPTADEVQRLRSGQVLVGFLEPLTDHAGIERLAERGVHAFAGVAGLQAIATAHRLGAVVAGFDVRPVVREQVESLGATFLDLGIIGEETAGGYARELTDEEERRQKAALEERIPDYDVAITTALVPGRAAPRLIPAGAVARMRPGSVIVDLAAETGGNCELTVPGEIVEREGVTIVGLTNLPSTMPFHASQLYARNVSALLQHLAPEGELVLDWDDEITAGACVTRTEVVA